jgi:hypothetical protein
MTMHKCDSIELLFNGTRSTFPLAIAGSALSPDSAQSLLVVYNGVVQEADIDFVVNTSNIVFTVAPHASRDCYILYSPNAVESDTAMYRVAATNLSAFKVVYDVGDGSVNYASFDVTAHASNVLGVTLHAANAASNVVVIRQGQIIDPTLGLPVGTLFLGSNGAIVSSPPSTGMLVQVGKASTSGIAVIDVQPAIIRG